MKTPTFNISHQYVLCWMRRYVEMRHVWFLHEIAPPVSTLLFCSVCIPLWNIRTLIKSKSLCLTCVWFFDWILLIHFTSLIKWIQYLSRRLSFHVYLMDFCFDDDDKKQTNQRYVAISIFSRTTCNSPPNIISIYVYTFILDCTYV